MHRLTVPIPDEEIRALHVGDTVYLNGIIDENETMNSATLPAVDMPNRDNFILAYPEP